MNRSEKHKGNSSGKPGLFEWLVAASLIIVLILVIVTGIYTYSRLNGIIDTVKSGIRPDRKLILVKEIMNDLSEAENHVKSYSLTNEESYMVSFYEITSLTGEKVEELRELWPGDVFLAQYIDTLDLLVDEKFTILDQLLVIQDEFRVQRAMQQVMQKISVQEKSPPEVIIPDTTAMKDETRIKESFFKRLFRSNKKRQEADSITQVVQQAPPADTLFSLSEIGRQVEQVKYRVLSREEKLRVMQLGLLQQNQAVMLKIRQVISILEEMESDALVANTNRAEHEADRVKQILVAFVLSSSLLLIVASLAIYRYARKNNEYKTILNKAREDAESLARAKELFLANMSHEIRTPMNIISGFLNQVLQGSLDPGQQEKLTIIKNSSDHLLRLLNDLLDLSKLQANKLELVETSFSPEALIDEVHQSLKPLADNKKLSFLASAGTGIPATIYGDEARIRQILLNLTGNAIKFTAKGEVALKASPLKTINDRVWIAFEVSDTGVGIRADELKQIFEAFEQGSGITGANKEGAGLGLSITSKLVERLGGTIRVESQPGKGSRFIAEVPFRQTERAPVKATGLLPDDWSALKGAVILAVDDEEYNRQLLKIILEKHGCTVMESESAEKAIALVETRNIDLVLMDIRMPGMDGPEAASAIKKFSSHAGKNIPVIAVSAAIAKDDLDTYRRKGMDDFIHKPLDEQTLLKMIIRYLNRQPARVDLEPLKTACEGNEKFFREMVNLFIQDTETGLLQIRDRVAHNDWENVSALAHKISAPGRHLRAYKLYALLKRIESLANEPGDVGIATDLLNQAKEEFDLIKADILSRHDLKDNMQP
ncbi:MAG: response regulator [Bacteroidales bacterium]|nr:response regulator [Bacteroidales bacterium]